MNNNCRKLFLRRYGEDQQHYLNATRYNYSSDTQKEINDLIGRLSKIAEDPKDYSYIRHCPYARSAGARP